MTRLRKVVLPAPLPPMSPTTVSSSMETLMSRAAVTAPKVLVRPVASQDGAHVAALRRRRKIDQSPSGRKRITASMALPITSCQVLGACS